MTSLPDIEWILGWTQNARWNSHQKMKEPFTAKAYQCRSTWKKIYSLSSPLCTNMGSSQSYLSQNTQVPFLHRGKSTDNYVLLRISGESIPWLEMLKITIVTQSAFCPVLINTWQESLYSATLIAPKPITVYRWPTNGQWKCLHSILLAERLPTNTFSPE